MFTRPILAAMLALALLVVIPAALLLTTDRDTTVVIPQTPDRPDGCIMFCPETPAVVGDQS